MWNEKQIASPNSYCIREKKVVINNIYAFINIRHEKSPATETKPKQVLSKIFRFQVLCSFIICGVVSFGVSRHQIKSKSSQLESEATTNITFMMIEFDLCGVSDLQIHIFLSFFFSEENKNKILVSISLALCWNCIISLWG